MLVQLLKIGSESSWNTEDDKLRFEGKVFYAKNKDQVKMMDRSYCNKPPVGYLEDVEIIIHKDIREDFIENYSFLDVDFKILRL